MRFEAGGGRACGWGLGAAVGADCFVGGGARVGGACLTKTDVGISSSTMTLPARALLSICDEE